MPSFRNLLCKAIRANSLDEIKKTLQHNDASVLLKATDTFGDTPLTDAFRWPKNINPETMLLLFSEIELIGGQKLLKTQLEHTNNSGTSFLGRVLVDSISIEVICLVIQAMIDLGSTAVLKQQLEQIDESGTNFLALFFTNHSVAQIQITMKTIIDAGGPELLKKQLEHTNSSGINFLTTVFMTSSSVELKQFAIKIITDVGGPELLKEQIEHTDKTGTNFFTYVFCYSSSIAVAKFAVETVTDVGGQEFLKKQLQHTNNKGTNFLGLVFLFSSSIDAAHLAITTITGVGGSELLKKQLEHTNKNGVNFLALVFVFSSSTEVAKLALETIINVGGSELLKKQLERTENGGNNFITTVFMYSSSTEVAKLALETIINVSGSELLKKQLEHTNNSGNNVLALVFMKSSSVEIANLALETIINVSGSELLKKQLEHTNKYGTNFLTVVFIKPSSIQVKQLAVKTITDASGPELLKKQLEYTNKYGTNFLTLVFLQSSSIDAANLALKTITDAGGPEFLKEQLEHTNKDGVNFLALVFIKPSSIQVKQLAVKTITDASGPELLKKQLEYTDTSGFNFLALVFISSSSAEVANLAVKTITDVSGSELLKKQLEHTNKNGVNFLALVFVFSSSTEVAKLALETIINVGGSELLKKQLERTENGGNNFITTVFMYSSSTEVAKLALETIIDVGGPEFLKKQLEHTNNSGNNVLALVFMKSSSVEIANLALETIINVGGRKLLKKQLEHTENSDKKLVARVFISSYNNGVSFLALVCMYSSTVEVVQLAIKTITDAGGPELLKKQLEHTKNKYACNFLGLVFGHSTSIKVAQLAVETICDVGGSALLQKQIIREKAFDSNFLTSYNMPDVNFLTVVFRSSSNSIEIVELAIKTITGVGGLQLLKSQADALLSIDRKCCVSRIKSLLLYAPTTALDCIHSWNLLPSTVTLEELVMGLLNIEGLTSQTLVTVCAMIFDGLFREQYLRLIHYTLKFCKLANVGIYPDWTPEGHINQLLESNPRQALQQFNLFCTYTSNPPLGFLNDKVLHSEGLLETFAAPSLVNYLAERKCAGTFAVELTQVYDELVSRTSQKVDALSNEQEAAHRKLVRIEMKELSDLFHQRLFDSLSLERAHFMHESANAFGLRYAYLIKSAPLRRISKSHSIPLSENIIQRLTEQKVMESGLFDVLDSYRLERMSISNEDRVKILRLVRLHNAQNDQRTSSPNDGTQTLLPFLDTFLRTHGLYTQIDNLAHSTQQTLIGQQITSFRAFLPLKTSDFNQMSIPVGERIRIEEIQRKIWMLTESATARQLHSMFPAAAIFPWGSIKLGQELGRGGFGCVKKAALLAEKNSETQQYVALKLFSHARPDRVLQECRVAFHLYHENIIETKGVTIFIGTTGHEEVAAVLALGRETLHQKLDATVKWKTVFKYCFEIASGLDYLHNHARMNHLDLKPANVLLDEHDTVKLCDFGLSRVMEEDATFVDVSHAGFGSYRWMCPEQVNSTEMRPANDVYSFGCILYNMIDERGRKPWHGVPENKIREMLGSPENIAESLLAKKIASEHRTDCPEFLLKMCENCLHSDYKQRPQDGGAVVQLLKNEILDLIEKHEEWRVKIGDVSYLFGTADSTVQVNEVNHCQSSTGQFSAEESW